MGRWVGRGTDLLLLDDFGPATKNEEGGERGAMSLRENERKEERRKEEEDEHVSLLGGVEPVVEKSRDQRRVRSKERRAERLTERNPWL